jgi:hypothetical protein
MQKGGCRPALFHLREATRPLQKCSTDRASRFISSRAAKGVVQKCNACRAARFLQSSRGKGCHAEKQAYGCLAVHPAFAKAMAGKPSGGNRPTAEMHFAGCRPDPSNSARQKFICRNAIRQLPRSSSLGRQKNTCRSAAQQLPPGSFNLREALEDMQECNWSSASRFTLLRQGYGGQVLRAATDQLQKCKAAYAALQTSVFARQNDAY